MDDRSQNRFLALPQSGKGTGVLVLHAWWGVNDFIKGFCQRLAGEGFVVLAPDLYHGRVAATIEEAERLRSKLKRKQTGAEILAAVDELQRLPAVSGGALGTIGFSNKIVCMLMMLKQLSWHGRGHWYF